VLPEFFATGYQFVSKDEVAALAESVPDGETTRFLVTLSQEKGIYIVAGLPEKDSDTFYKLSSADRARWVYRLLP